MSASRIDVLDENRSALSKICRLAWPVTLSMLFHISYSIVDLLWVKSLGREAVAALTLSGIIFWAMFAVSQVFGMGVHALVARACGAGEHEKAGRVCRDGIGAAMLTGVLVGTLVFFNAKWILGRLGAQPDVIATGAPYVRIMALSPVATAGLFSLSASFRATGDMITPLILTGAACALNIVLDPILIFGADMGVAGAGAASVISAAAAFVWALTAVGRRSTVLRIWFKGMPDPVALKDMLAVGVPAGLHYMLLSLSQMVGLRLVAGFGTPQVAATGIGGRILHVAFLPCMGIGAATATMVGQYLGAKQTEQAETAAKTAVRVNFLVTALIGGCYALFPEILLRPFSPDPEILALGVVYLRILAVTLVFVTATITLTRVFQGAGYTAWPSAIMGVRFLVFLGFARLLGWTLEFEVYGVWLAMGLSAAVQTVIVAWLFTLGTWKRRRLRSVE